MNNSNQINESLVSNYIVYRILKLLLTDFKKWDAFKLGLINDKGERTDKKLESNDEKESWNLLNRFTARIKRIIERFLGKSKLSALFSITLFLKECEDQIDFENLNEDEYIQILDEIERLFEEKEGEYQGKKVTLEKPFRLKNDNKKFGVYVKNPKTKNVILVKFGDPNMEIKRDDPERQKAFQARHNCADKNDKTTPGYWSCKYTWAKNKTVTDVLKGK